MTISIIPTLENYYTVKQQHQDHRSPYCTLQWRRGQLLVKPLGQLKQPYLPVLDKKQSLVECLKHSPINLVRIDPKLDQTKLKLWAEACLAASKPIFLCIPKSAEAKPPSPLLRLLQRVTDLMATLVFLLFASPLMLVLILLMGVYSPGSLFEREWHVGERGRLFQVIKFRTTAANKDIRKGDEDEQATPLGRWMRKYGLDNLPQLLNVLRGEMSLVGPRCWSLSDALRLMERQQLNKLPGITGSWEVAASNQLHLDSQIL